MRWCLLVFLLGIAMLMACSSDQTASDDLPLQATASPAVAAEAHTPETEVVLPTAVLNTVVPTQVVLISASPTVASTVSLAATAEATDLDRSGHIAYVSSDAEIFTINPHGSNQQRTSPGISDPSIPTLLRPDTPGLAGRPMEIESSTHPSHPPRRA